ncbi:hypothetical protein [Adlercreutzia mucosicola]|jgi:hypothetical protein|uniref:hypothetical protein n=2 Tax=Adlercreutzia TaxID=447020 RepID=UPI002B251B68|nr:hypothetical protein [Adlercreutzia mucosicola]MCI9494793.1 hypothetical protein [Adlercreutzia mucosicola]MEB1814012.1 hypothetical protein [Adlercreutzia mucosicola]NCA33199.1 hypothetical protein [Adlercreutzia muris]
MQMNEMPSIGTTLTYGEAIKAYDRFERTMLEKAYGAGLLPAVGLYDLLWQLESLAQKFGIEGKGAFSRLKREIRSFSSERTALANGVNGERFYLLQDESALRQHDETHLFKVGIDVDRLARDLDEALELLSKESAKTDEYGDTYSTDWSELASGKQEKDPFLKWAGIGFCVMMVCLGVSMLVHSVFQIGFCSKWFI